jgi:hypothetical protein
MEHQREEEKRAWEAGYQVVKVARRVYVGNLAWKTSWQDLKVRLYYSESTGTYIKLQCLLKAFIVLVVGPLFKCRSSKIC